MEIVGYCDLDVVEFWLHYLVADAHLLGLIHLANRQILGLLLLICASVIPQS